MPNILLHILGYMQIHMQHLKLLVPTMQQGVE